MLLYEDLESLTPYMHTEDDVVGVSLNAPGLFEANARLAAAAIATLAGSLSARFPRGDANADGGLDIADAIYVLDHLFRRRAALACPDAADANDDGGLDVADAVTILGTLVVGGGPLPPPSAGCGFDPTEDGLDCESHAACPSGGTGE